MIKGISVTVYNWFDIQNEICRTMGIERDKFRDYHKVIGGDYLDLWHVALATVVPDNMSRDTIVTMFDLDDESIEYFVKARGEWTRSFFNAYHSVIQKLDPEDNGIYVKFIW